MFMSIVNEVIVPAAANNPLDGVTPNINVFGVKFQGAIQLILGGIWAALLGAVAGLLIGHVLAKPAGGAS